MRIFSFTALLATACLSALALAADPATAQVYTTESTEIGTLLDDPAAKAVIDKHLPGFSTGGQVDMTRSLTLRSLQQYAPDVFSDEALAKIDADLAALAKKAN